MTPAMAPAANWYTKGRAVVATRRSEPHDTGPAEARARRTLALGGGRSGGHGSGSRRAHGRSERAKERAGGRTGARGDGRQAGPGGSRRRGRNGRRRAEGQHARARAAADDYSQLAAHARHPHPACNARRCSSTVACRRSRCWRAPPRCARASRAPVARSSARPRFAPSSAARCAASSRRKPRACCWQRLRAGCNRRRCCDDTRRSLRTSSCTASFRRSLDLSASEQRIFASQAVFLPPVTACG